MQQRPPQHPPTSGAGTTLPASATEADPPAATAHTRTRQAQTCSCDRIPDLPVFPNIASLFIGNNDWFETLIAWHSMYLRGYGNACLLLDENGPSCYVGTKGVVVASAVERGHGICVPTVEEVCLTVFDSKNNLPIPVGLRQLSFFSVRSRTVEMANDGAFSWISSGHIAEMVVSPEDADYTLIRLTNGYQITAIQPLASCRKRRVQADTIRKSLAYDGYIADAGVLAVPANPAAYLLRVADAARNHPLHPAHVTAPS